LLSLSKSNTLVDKIFGSYGEYNLNDILLGYDAI